MRHQGAREKGNYSTPLKSGAGHLGWAWSGNQRLADAGTYAKAWYGQPEKDSPVCTAAAGRVAAPVMRWTANGWRRQRNGVREMAAAGEPEEWLRQTPGTGAAE